jgi:hypothetical protein
MFLYLAKLASSSSGKWSTLISYEGQIRMEREHIFTIAYKA